jgi:hypothetical protein
MLAMQQEARMMVDDAGDGPIRRHSKVPDLLRYQERYETSSTRQTRTKAKVTTNTVRNNIVHRVDYGVEIMCILLAVDQMQRGEFESWIALKEGVLFDPAPKKRMRRPTRRNWFVIPPPAKSATVEQVARHYGYTEESVRRMDQRARKMLTEIRAAAGLLDEVPKVQIWPAVMTQRSMMAHLFG